MSAESHRSGKTHRDENFPVARLVQARHREIILAFYDFVRTADDVADHPQLSDSDKLRMLDDLESALDGADAGEPSGVKLRALLRARNLTDRHARDLLNAFRQDVVQRRYEDWELLIGYCKLSAMPVGRFVLDVHGEAPTSWAASDPLCAALQIINHIQDCGLDYKRLDRVYIPLDAFARAGARVEELGGDASSPRLRACLAETAAGAARLLAMSAPLPRLVHDVRLALECAAIQRLAERLAALLQRRDPLSEPVHLTKSATLGTIAFGAASGAFARLGRFTAIRPLGKRQA